MRAFFTERISHRSIDNLLDLPFRWSASGVWFDWHSPPQSSSFIVAENTKIMCCWLSCGRHDTDTCGNLASFHRLMIAGPVWNSCDLELFSHFDKTPHRPMVSCGQAPSRHRAIRQTDDDLVAVAKFSKSRYEAMNGSAKYRKMGRLPMRLSCTVFEIFVSQVEFSRTIVWLAVLDRHRSMASTTDA